MPPSLPPAPLGCHVGPAGAKVTLTTWVDFVCPYSKRLFDRLTSEEFRAARRSRPPPNAFSCERIMIPRVTLLTAA